MLLQLGLVLLLIVLAGVGLTAGRLRGSLWPGAMWFFSLLLLGSWALAIWLPPVGPNLLGTRPVPYVIAAVMVSVVLALVTTVGRRASDDVSSDAEQRVAMGVTVRAFLWVATLVAAAAIAIDCLTAS